MARVAGDLDDRPRPAKLNGLFRNETQLEVRDFPLERHIGHAVEQAAILAVGRPRPQQCGEPVDLITVVLGQPRLGEQLDQGTVCGKFLRVDALGLRTITLNGRRERYRGRGLASGCRNSERSVRRSVCRIERHAEGTADKNQRTTSWPAAEPTKHHQAAKHRDKHPIRPTPRRYTRSRISALAAGSS